jgi:plasmid replication initiation protein
LKRWGAFQERVLQPAIAEIQHITGIDVDYVPVKRARRVIGVTLIIGEKQGEAVEEAKKELNNVRTGRKARRTKMVEAIADEKKTLAAKLNPTE